MVMFRPGMQQAPVFGGDSAYFNQSQQYPMYSQDNMVVSAHVHVHVNTCIYMHMDMDMDISLAILTVIGSETHMQYFHEWRFVSLMMDNKFSTTLYMYTLYVYYSIHLPMHVCMQNYSTMYTVKLIALMHFFVVQSKGQVSSRAAVGGLMGAGGMHPQIKQEMIDPAFEDLECKSRERERRGREGEGGRETERERGRDGGGGGIERIDV